MITLTTHQLVLLAGHLGAIHTWDGRFGLSLGDTPRADVQIDTARVAEFGGANVWAHVTINGHSCGNRHGGAEAYARLVAGDPDWHRPYKPAAEPAPAPQPARKPAPAIVAPPADDAAPVDTLAMPEAAARAYLKKTAPAADLAFFLRFRMSAGLRAKAEALRAKPNSKALAGLRLMWRAERFAEDAAAGTPFLRPYVRAIAADIESAA